MEKSNSDYILLNDQDVVHSSDTEIRYIASTFKVAELQEKIGYDWPDQDQALLEDGIDCEILRPGQPKWQTGKIRLCILFTPDPPDSNSEQGSNSELLEEDSNWPPSLDELRD